MFLVFLLLILDHSRAAPAARETYRMPQNALQALSDRGTVVLDAALASALSALELAEAERRRAESGCRGCVPCLFQDCGQRSGPCDPPGGSSLEPTCEDIGLMQRLVDEGERHWALSQACGFYRRRCSPGLLERAGCVRTMAESCNARVLQCSLLHTMQSLEPALEPSARAVCGRRAPAVRNATLPRARIVGGQPAALGSWPWLVNVKLDGVLMCGGVLVDSSWVMTAAHCFSGSRSESYWTVVVGEFDVTKTDPDEQVIKVNRIISHPKFNPKTFNNDIALVELTAPVMLSDLVTPVCLPSGPEPPAGTPCFVAGWGSLYEDGPSADRVMEAKVPLLPQNTCKAALGKELVTNTMFCAGFLSGGIDSCQGDSGGPLIYQDRPSGRFQLYGITSWGDGCGEKGKPGVYTRVTAFSDWIQTEIQKSAGSREPTCPELLKTSELSVEQQSAEFSSLCRFFALSCSPTLGVAACDRLVEDKCRSRFKRCQLRSFLQTLLDLLQRAEDYIRDRVDLTFFTHTLPQLVEHVYSAAFSPRDRRAAPEQAEQVGLRVSLGLQPPSLFEEVGPLAGDWADYLRGIAEDLDQQPDQQLHTLPQEKSLFLQMEDTTLHRLHGEYRSLIDSLRSKLGSRVALTVMGAERDRPSAAVPYGGAQITPTITVPRSLASVSALSSYLELGATPIEDPTTGSPESSTAHGSQVTAGSPETSTAHGSQVTAGSLETSTAHGSQVTAGFPETSTAHGSQVTAGSPESSTAHRSQVTAGSPESSTAHGSQVTASDWASSESLFSRLSPHTDGQQAARSDPLQVTPSCTPTLCDDSSPTRRTLHRRRRGLHRRRRGQASAPNAQDCPAVAEMERNVILIRDMYRWILGMPSKSVSMNFQEVLVDLASKNERGLYQARIRATVGGRSLTFYSLVGLENEAFYRSMPRVIALALDALKA